ncbi:MAG: hypothetical protein ACQESD_03595 [Thermoplasmatota archaeon]
MKMKLYAAVVTFFLFSLVIFSAPAKSVPVATTLQGYTVDSYDGSAQTTSDGNTLIGNITAIHPGDPNGVDVTTISNSFGALENDDPDHIDGWSWGAKVEYGDIYISVPTGYASSYHNASDIVEDIEGGLGKDTNMEISSVLNWNASLQKHDESFYFMQDPFMGDGWTGDDFQIENGDSIGFEKESDNTWNINGTDSTDSISFSFDSDSGKLHYISVPYTLKDHNGDGNLTARDLHISMDSTTPLDGSHISEIRNFSGERWSYSERYHEGLSGWIGDFSIAPGDGISVMVEKNFTWTPELITEPVPTGSSQGVDGLWIEKNKTTGNFTLHWNDIGSSGGYNVYHSTDRLAPWPWSTLDTGVSGTSFTHPGVLSDGNSDYYIVRGTDGVNETANSSMAFCVEKDFTYYGGVYSGDDRWREAPDDSSDLGDEVYFIGEQVVSGYQDVGYVWCTNQTISAETNLPDSKERNTARWEEIPAPDSCTIGSDWINLTIEHPTYTTPLGNGGGTYDNLHSYAVFIRGGNYSSFTYIGNSKLLGNHETDPGSYDAPIDPFDWDNHSADIIDPETITTGEDYFNTSDHISIGDPAEYEYMVRMNLDVNASGGYRGGLGVEVYTSYGFSEIVQIATIPIDEYPSQIYPVIITLGMMMAIFYHRRKKR